MREPDMAMRELRAPMGPPLILSLGWLVSLVAFAPLVYVGSEYQSVSLEVMVSDSARRLDIRGIAKATLAVRPPWFHLPRFLVIDASLPETALSPMLIRTS